jgi:hypothetical protein
MLYQLKMTSRYKTCNGMDFRQVSIIFCGNLIISAGDESKKNTKAGAPPLLCMLCQYIFEI